MLRIPILSRLSWWEYVQIIGTLVFLVAEWTAREVLKRLTYFLPSLGPTSSFNYSYFNFPTAQVNGADSQDSVDSYGKAGDKKNRPAKKEGGKTRLTAYELLADLDVGWEEHMVVTTDGYVLMLQRLVPSSTFFSTSSESDATLPPSPSLSNLTPLNGLNLATTMTLSDTSSSLPPDSRARRRPPVLLIPGCMLSSEVWLCHQEPGKNLPIVLLRAGYDVWLGNRRGSQYCPKHLQWPSDSEQFWDFCLDDVARHDLPAMIGCTLEATGAHSLTLIGFSQGTAEIFAYLAQCPPSERRRVNLVLALGAMTKPMGMRHAYVRALVHANPHVFYLLFGRKRMLGSVSFWIRVLPNQLYAHLIKLVLHSLFGWRGEHIHEPHRMFPHMYTTTSVKTIVHWFQLMQHETFGMYRGPGETVSVRYPLESVRTPIVVFYGQRDTLCDSQYTRVQLRNALVGEYAIKTYEHLDFLFADDVDTMIYPVVLQELGKLKQKRAEK
jgi:pimeloyl-ACP methyl ester carboxylesterase